MRNMSRQAALAGELCLRLLNAAQDALIENQPVTEAFRELVHVREYWQYAAYLQTLSVICGKIVKDNTAKKIELRRGDAMPEVARFKLRIQWKILRLRVAWWFPAQREELLRDLIYSTSSFVSL